MKATFIKSVLLITVLFAGIANSEMNAKTKFVTNDEIKDDLVISKTIYRHDVYLYRHLKYNFTYDEQSRLVTKEAFRWNGNNEQWEPYYKVDYSYMAYQSVVEYAKWNEKEKAYNLARERSIYEKNEMNTPVAYMNYEWNDTNNAWIKTENLIFNQTDNLLAYKR